jgi:hypothetical protein
MRAYDIDLITRGFCAHMCFRMIAAQTLTPTLTHPEGEGEENRFFVVRAIG